VNWRRGVFSTISPFSPIPSLAFSFSLFPLSLSPSFPFPLPPLKTRTPKIALRVMGCTHCTVSFPSEGLAWNPNASGNRIQCRPIISLIDFKIWDLAATMLLIFLRINWPNLEPFKRVLVFSGRLGGGQLVPWAPPCLRHWVNESTSVNNKKV